MPVMQWSWNQVRPKVQVRGELVSSSYFHRSQNAVPPNMIRRVLCCTECDGSVKQSPHARLSLFPTLICLQACQGSGVQVIMRPLGPGMMQQIQQPCSRCNQTGYSTPAHDLCGDCSGKVSHFPPSPLISARTESSRDLSCAVILEAAYLEVGDRAPTTNMSSQFCWTKDSSLKLIVAFWKERVTHTGSQYLCRLLQLLLKGRTH